MVRRLFRPDGPGAGLVHEPVRLCALASFRGGQRTLGEREVRVLARSMVRAVMDSPGGRPSRRTASTGSPRCLSSTSSPTRSAGTGSDADEGALGGRGASSPRHRGLLRAGCRRCAG
ncbi:hypothetical protein [Streptomyces canus]|uniref:NACHT N-terminal Helical domain 1-containing protein n=1 Tax=Streptomyces canus TaxID=58343 RepID=UPI003806EB6E